MMITTVFFLSPHACFLIDVHVRTVQALSDEQVVRLQNVPSPRLVPEHALMQSATDCFCILLSVEYRSIIACSQMGNNAFPSFECCLNRAYDFRFQMLFSWYFIVDLCMRVSHVKTQKIYLLISYFSIIQMHCTAAHKSATVYKFDYDYG